MTREQAEPAIKACISLLDRSVREAHGLAGAAQHCLEASDTERAFRIALEIEPLLQEADALLQAAGAIRRRME